jgi:hypothetical protein
MKGGTEININYRGTGNEEKEEGTKKECEQRREKDKICCSVAYLFRLIHDSCRDALVRSKLNRQRPAPKLIIRATDPHCGLHTNSVFFRE